MSQELREGILQTAKDLGVSPQDVATTISYETAGTLDPWQKGSAITQHGEHRGLIQWGESQRRDYGVYKGMPVKEQMKAVTRYLRDRGVRPGHGLLQIYSAINAGGVGEKYYNRSDAGNGGAPGTVRDKVRDQMEGHKRKGAKLLGGLIHAPGAGRPDPVTQAGPSGPEPAGGGAADLEFPAAYTPPDPSLYAAPRDLSDRGGTKFADSVYTPVGGASLPMDNAEIAGVAEFNEKSEGYGFLGGLGAAIKTDWAVSWAMQEMGKFAPDPDFVQTDEDFIKTMEEKGIDTRYWGHVYGAQSEGEMWGRMKWVQEDAVRNQKLDAMGLPGMGLRMITAVLDPTALAAIVASEGIAIPAMAALKLKRLGSILMEGGAIGTAEAVNMGVTSRYNPNITDADIGIAFGLGGLLGGAVGGWRANSALKGEAVALERAMQGMIKRKTDIVDGVIAKPDVNAGSGGAATNNDYIAAALGDTPEIDMADVKQSYGADGWLGKTRTDSGGQNMGSDDALVRHMTPEWVEEQPGFVGGGEAPAPISMRGQTITERAMLEFNQSYAPQLRGYASARGKRLSDTLVNEFDKEVFLATHQLDHAALQDPHIRAAVKANADSYERWAAMIENPGLNRGEIMQRLASVEKRRTYQPLITDGEQVNRMIRTHGEKKLTNMLAEAIRKGPLGGKIDEKVVHKMAKGYLAKLSQSLYGIEDGMQQSFTLGSRQDFKDAMKISVENAADRFEGGMEEVDIDKIFDLIDDVGVDPKAAGGDVRHLKSRTLMDYTSEFGVVNDEGVTEFLKPLDFFVQNAQSVHQRYSRVMGGKIALAQTKIFNPTSGELIVDGIRNKQDFEHILNWIRDASKMSGTKKGQTLKQKLRKHKRDIENMKYWYDDIVGNPHYDQNTGVSTVLRRVGEFQIIRLMNNMGLNQFQEFSRIMGMAGLKAFRQNMPAFRRVIDDAGKNIAKDDKFLDDLQHATGLGADADFPQHHAARMDDDRIGVGAGDKVDDVLAKGIRVTTMISGMNHTMAFQQKWALKAFSQQLYDMSLKVVKPDGTVDLSRLSKMQRRKLDTVGLGDKKMRRVFSEMRKHGTTTGNRGKLEMLHTSKWDTAIKAEFVDTLTRQVNRAVHRNDAGSLNRFMSTNSGAKIATQFRSFIIGSYAKSTLYNLNHLDMATFSTMMMELMAAMLTYTVITGMRSVGRPDRDEYVKERLSWDAIAAAGFGRAAFMSLIPSVVDTATSLTPFDPLFGNVRSSGQGSDALFGNPSGSFIKQGFNSVPRMLESITTGKNVTPQQLRSLAGMGPFANWMVAAPLLNVLTQVGSDN